MTGQIKTFLMFEGACEQAINTYVSLFEDAVIDDIRRYGPDGPGAAGTVMRATFTLKGQTFMAIDSPIKHDFGFTPAISLFVDCADEAEIDRLFAVLSEGGKILMPLDRYAFSRRFAWVADKFGVSWQLSLVGDPAS
jgi:predicted 3-demethylubiquinone-9 3-methyltransferase (glyoxalase superfamily)